MSVTTVYIALCLVCFGSGLLIGYFAGVTKGKR